MSDIGSYIKESSIKARNNKEEWKLFGNVDVFIKDPFIQNINMENVISRIQKALPSRLAYGLDSIYVGQFSEFEEKETNAFFADGAIYVTNAQDNEEDLIDDIVHEMAHLVEEANGFEIYSDGQLQEEFLGKRKRLYYILSSEGYDVEILEFMSPEYSRKFDNFLYKKVGYANLEQLIQGLFYSPYAATSLREYFANGFEAFFLKKEQKYLQSISPVLYNKIESILDTTGEK